MPFGLSGLVQDIILVNSKIICCVICRFNIQLGNEEARSDVNALIDGTNSYETIYKGKKYGKLVRVPETEEFNTL